MIYESIAKRYAEALFEVASSQGAVRDWETQLLMIQDSLKGHRFISKALLSPQITHEVKSDMLRKIFAGRIPAQLLNFLNILVEKRRENYLEAIIRGYQEKVREQEGTVMARVTVASLPTARVEEELAGALSRLSGKKVRLELEVDPAIIGGVVVRMEGRLLDWSIAGHLNTMKEKMVSVS